jgi:hypothetical protein
VPVATPTTVTEVPTPTPIYAGRSFTLAVPSLVDSVATQLRFLKVHCIPFH